MIKGILIDYGGTIDTNGKHWANVIWEAYVRLGVKVARAQFMEAYAFGEKALAVHPLIRPDYTFEEVLRVKLRQQFGFLALDTADDRLEGIVAHCMSLVKATVAEARRTLDTLSAHYPMVLVSNFYGNIQTVLSDLQIRPYFDAIVESAVVGVRKPNPEIYRLGVEAIGFQADECVVIGDSYKKDIIPGNDAGCQTIWLNVDGFAEDLENVRHDMANRQITDFSQIPSQIAELNAYGLA